MRTSLRMYNGLVERCFISCVDSFRRKTLEKHEEQARYSGCDAFAVRR
jgi:import inner membrane translocase subunit TIM9